MTPQKASVFDYTITITRKARHLVVASPEFGIQVSSQPLDLGRLSPEAIGGAVLGVLERIGAKLHQCRLRGEVPPAPLASKTLSRWQGRERLQAGMAAKALGISTATLRKMVRDGHIRAQRTPGGHLRFAIHDLSEYLGRATVTHDELPQNESSRPMQAA